jgi:hypothetical protein
MKISEMTPEQIEAKRRYDRAAKRKSRAKQKAESIPTADEWFRSWSTQFLQQSVELKTYERQLCAKVYEELGRGEFDPYRSPEAETFSWVAITLYSLRKNTSPWVREVRDPDGILVGGLLYPDALGSDFVENTHRFELEESATYSALYRELLRILDERFGHEHTDHACDIKLELAGTYVLKLPEPEPKPKPGVVPEASPVASDGETVERGRIQSLDELQQQFRVRDPNIAPEARRYLDGTA